MSPSLLNPNAALRTWWQRTLFLLLLLAGGFTFSAKAQTVTIGTGTTALSTSPIYGLYGYSYSQNLYLGSELTANGWGGGSGLIDKIRFYLSSTPATPANSNNWTVYVGNTALTSLTAGPANYTPASAMTMVFTGTVDLTTTGWKEITFSSPFSYNGTNLIIAVDENAPGYSGCSWYSTAATNMVRYLYSDSYNPDPTALPGSYSGSSGTNPSSRPNIQISLLVPCTGTPVAGTLPANTPTCVGSSITLSPTGGSVAASLTYLWEQSTDGGTTWANAGGTNTNATYTTAPYSGPISYRRTTTCTPSGQSSTTNATALNTTTPYFAFVNSYTQSFESWSNRCSTTDVPGSNWLNTPAATDSSWRRNDQGASAGWTAAGSGMYTPAFTSGAYSARFHSTGAANGTSGRLDFYMDMSAATGSTKLKFDYINTSGSDVLQLRISTDGGTTFSDLGGVLGQTGASWNTSTEYTVTSTSPTTIIRFRATNYGVDNSDIGLDNVRLFTPCSGTPAAAVATATPSSVCAGNTAVITTTGTGDPVTGISFQWEQSNDGSTGWVPIPGATATTYTTPALSAARYFRLKQSCSYSSSFSYSNTVGVTQVTTPYAAYNNVSFTEDFENWASVCSTSDVPSLNWRNTPYSGNNSWRRDDQGSTASWTSNSGAYTPVASTGTHSARFHSYNATSGSQGSLDLYIDMSTATGPSRLTFDYINTSGTDVLGVWVSTSGGAAGTFQQIGSNLGIAAAWGSKTFDFSSTSATTVVRLQATSDAGSTDIGLDNFKIAPAPSCLPPFNLVAIGTTSTTGSLFWAGSLSTPSNGYLWEVRTTGLPGNPGSAAANGSTAAGVTNATATGLAASTTYNLYVRSTCNNPDTSVWAGPVAFTTPCGPTAVPYAQNFDGATTPVLPACISRQTISGSDWTTVTAPTGMTGKSAQCANNAAASDSWLYTQALTLTGGTNYRISYKYKGSVATNTQKMSVAYGTSAAAAAMVNALANYPSIMTTTAQSAFVDFTPATSGDYFIGFRCYAAASQGILYLDDISVALSPACIQPTALTLGAVTPASAAFSWTASFSNPANGYKWEVRTTGLPGNPGSATASGSTAAGITTATATGLTNNTAYNIYVRSTCSAAADTSVWTGPLAFTTPATTPVPWNEPFATTTTPTGWNTSGWSIGSLRGVTGNPGNNIYKNLHSSATTGTFSTINVGPIIAGLTLSFDYKASNYSSTNNYDPPAANSGSFVVAVSTDFGATFTNLETVTNDAFDGWRKKTYPMAAYVGQYVQVRITATWVSGDWDYGFDNFRIEGCSTPAGLAMGAITFNSAAFSWTANTPPPGNGYQWEVRTTGAGGSGATGLAASGNAVSANGTASGLASATVYSLYVRTDCGGNYSAWAGPVNFATPCNAANIPYTENFNGVTTPALPICMSNQVISGNPWTTKTAPAGMTGNVANVSFTGSGSPDMNSWLFTQGLNLTGGSTYRLSYKYFNNDGTTYTERMAVAYGSNNNAASMTNALADHSAIHSSTVLTNQVDFTPASTGVYYIGYKCYSIADQNQLYLDDISVQMVQLCAGTPDPGATTGPATACTGSTFTLGMANNPGVTLGYTYQWQTSADGSTWANGTGTSTNATYATSQTASTWYRVQMTCTNSGLTAASTPMQVTLNTDACICNAYCVAANGSGNCLASVSLNTLSATSTGCGAGPSYYQMMAQTTSLEKGMTYALAVSTASDAIVSVWFDWDGNGTFSTTEWTQVYTSASTGTVNITVPFSAVTGSTRMRIRSRATGNSNGAGDACTSMGSGSSQDYCITLLPSSACSVLPAPGNTTGPSNICANTNFTLGVQNSTVGLGVSYQWESSTDGSTWANAAGTSTNITYTTSLTASTWYRCQVTCTNTGTVASAALQVSLLNDPCQCGAYAANYASSTADEDIGNVTVGSMNNSSTCATTAPGAGSIKNRYSNYTGSVAGASAQPGDVVPFSVDVITCGGNYGNGVQIYVDWNQDGIFQDSEQMYSQPDAQSGPHTVSGNFAVPNMATVGSTRIRVVAVETTFPTTTNYATLGYSYGETEDYCFTVLPPPPCAGTPAPGNTLSSSAQACPNGGSFTLSLQNATLGSGVTYQWQSANDAAFTVSVVNMGTAFTQTVTNQTSSKYYRCQVSCTASGLSAYSTPVQVSMGDACTACGYPASYAIYTADEDISNVTVGSMNNSSDCSTVAPGPGSLVNQYGNYAGYVTGPNAQPGDNVPFSLTMTTCNLSTNYNNGFAIYIDWNQNGNFLDAGETVYSQAANVSGNQTVTGTFMVPYGTMAGTTRMRVVNVEGYSPSTNYGQTTYSYGETEDYCFTVLPPPPCTPPVAAVTGVGATSANLGWTNNGANSYNYEVRTSGAAGSGATGLVVSGNVASGTPAFAITPLAPQTSYSVYVQSVCDGGATLSAWNSAVNFTTPCLADNTPFAEGFETGYTDQTTVAGCWTQQGIAGTNTWTANSTLTNYNRTPRTGSFNAYLRYGNTRWLFRAINLTGGTTYRFSAYARQDGATAANASLTLAYGASATDAGMTNVLVTQALVNGGYQLVQGDFTPATTGVYYVGIKGTINSSPWYISLDDISVMELTMCAGTPNPGATTGPASICATTPFTLALGNDPGQVIGYSFQWQTSADGSTWANASGTSTNATYATSQTASTWYRCQMTCTASNSTTASTPLQVDINTNPCQCNTYCATSNDGGACLGSVSINTLNSTTAACVPAPGYTMKSATTTLAKGNTYALNVATIVDATYPNAIVSVWIDWNADGTFAASEWTQVYTSAASGTVNITVPMTAVEGSTRMRIRSRGAGNQNGAGDACLSMGSGTTEDYCITVGPPPSCLSPSALTIGAATSATVDFSWMASTSNPANGYQWEVRTSGTGGSGATGLVASGNTAAGVVNASANGLSANTAYTLFVRSDCSGGDFSTWAGPVGFNTPCNSTNVPYLENFNTTAVGSIPACMSRVTVSGNPWAVGNNITNQTSPAAISYYDANQAKNNWLFTQGLNLTAGTSYRLSYTYLTSTYTEKLEVKYGTAATVAGMTALLFDHGAFTSPVYATKVVDFTPTATGIFYVGFHAYSDADEDFILVDDISVKLTPTCEEPVALMIGSMGVNSAGFSWTASISNPSGGYQWEVRASGAGGSGATGLVASGNTAAGVTTANASGLTNNTTYNFYVRANCGGGDLSFWAGPLAFTTGVACGNAFYDTGGIAANYGNNENWVKTYCRTTPGDQVRVLFNSFYTEASYDKLFVFNGPSTAAPKLASTNGAGFGNTTYGTGGWWGNLNTNLPGPFTSSNASGCLTFAFVSNGSTNYAGWEAITQCVTPNNTCANSTPVTCGSTYPGITAGVPHSMPASACPFNGPASTGGQNWYTYTATGNDAITFSTCGNNSFDTRLSVFTGATCSSLSCVAMNDDAPGCANGGSTVTINTTTGTQYWIAVHGAGAAEGTYQISVTCGTSCTPPANDACAGATAVANVLANGTGTAGTYGNNCATGDAPTTCSGTLPVNGVWFSFNSGAYNRALLTLQDHNSNGAFTAT
ncbi:MAG: choice-of-anchor J domain-containing protein, partial [Bacteroidetes bacterium]|nr:choice-of-anchor J domain-containing protein [Bacteroidota bacterium]